MTIIKIWVLTLFLYLFSTQLYAIDTFEKFRPPNVDDIKWNSLKQSINETKFLPQPAGTGGNNIKVGQSVSIDGDRALVSAHKMGTTGYVYVLEYDGINWIKTATIKPNVRDKIQFNFGAAVSLSGNRALIFGAIDSTGCAYIFDYDGTNWIETQLLVASEGIGFSGSVSLSGDRAVIGAEHDSTSNLNYSGSAFVFDYDGTTWIETQKLTANDAQSYDRFGNTVDFSGDTILIGAQDSDGSSIGGGSAYVFKFNGTSWNQTQKLIDSSNGFYSKFGNTLSISEDYALIGTQSENSYIFEFDGTNWNETHQFSSINGDYDYVKIKSVILKNNQAMISGLNSNLTTSEVSVFSFDGSNWSKDQQISSEDMTEKYSFGTSVSLSGDNIIIGADDAVDINGNHSGAAFVYSDNGTNWENKFRHSITEDGSASAYFGRSVSLSGNRALVGAYGENDLGKQSGSAYVYEFDGTNWNEMQKLHASDGAELDYFAYSLSLLGDRAVIGAYGDDDNGESSGSVYVFDFDGKNWNQSQKLMANDGEGNDYFGKSVSLSDDRLMIGAERKNETQGTVFASGAVYVFDLHENIWYESEKITIPGSRRLGNSVNLLNDRAIIADSRDIQNGQNSGAAYIFEYNGASWNQTQKLIASDGMQSDAFGSSVDMSSSTVVIGARFDSDEIYDYSGSAYVFDHDGTNWNQTQMLVASNRGTYHKFGESVQILDNTILIGAIWERNNLARESGAAYIFNKNDTEWIQTQLILPNDASAFDNFGGSVSLGLNKVLIGAYGDNDHGNDSGSAYLIDIDLIYGNGFE